MSLVMKFGRKLRFLRNLYLNLKKNNKNEEAWDCTVCVFQFVSDGGCEDETNALLMSPAECNHCVDKLNKVNACDNLQPALPSGKKVCVDTDKGAKNSQGETCAFFGTDDQFCETNMYYDDEDFALDSMCCVCGGGEWIEEGDIKKETTHSDKEADAAAKRATEKGICDKYSKHQGWCRAVENNR
eukprot:UN26634